MSAIISDVVQMKEILKATGFDCPEGMLGKTFSEVAGGKKWYCYKTKTNPPTRYYFKEEIPDADTPLIMIGTAHGAALVLSSLRKRHPHIISVICKDGEITVSYKNSEESSTSSYKLYRSPDDDLDLV